MPVMALARITTIVAVVASVGQVGWMRTDDVFNVSAGEIERKLSV